MWKRRWAEWPSCAARSNERNEFLSLAAVVGYEFSLQHSPIAALSSLSLIYPLIKQNSLIKDKRSIEGRLVFSLLIIWLTKEAVMRENCVLLNGVVLRRWPLAHNPLNSPIQAAHHFHSSKDKWKLISLAVRVEWKTIEEVWEQ